MELSETDASVYECLIDDYPAADAVLHTQIDGLDIIGSNINLVGAEVELMNRQGREHCLACAGTGQGQLRLCADRLLPIARNHHRQRAYSRRLSADSGPG